MKREYLPMDSIDRAGMMLGICLIGLAMSVGMFSIWELVKFVRRVLA